MTTVQNGRHFFASLPVQEEYFLGVCFRVQLNSATGVADSNANQVEFGLLRPTDERA